MTKLTGSKAFLLLAWATCRSQTLAQKMTPPCQIKISIAERDRLGNVNLGLSSDDRKWFERKVQKQYPMICYADQKSDFGIWFYIDISTVSSESATAATHATTDGTGNTASHTTITPSSVAYPVYTLKIGSFHEGNLGVLRTFQRTNADAGRGTVTGFVRSFSNPEHDVILDAMSWLSSNIDSIAATVSP